MTRATALAEQQQHCGHIHPEDEILCLHVGEQIPQALGTLLPPSLRHCVHLYSIVAPAVTKHKRSTKPNTFFGKASVIESSSVSTALADLCERPSFIERCDILHLGYIGEERVLKSHLSRCLTLLKKGGYFVAELPTADSGQSLIQAVFSSSRLTYSQNGRVQIIAQRTRID